MIKFQGSAGEQQRTELKLGAPRGGPWKDIEVQAIERVGGMNHGLKPIEIIGVDQGRWE